MPDRKASNPLPWTREEDEELMRLRALGKTYAQCAEAIGRTLGGCESRWRTIHSPKSRPAPAMWTPEEDALLAEFWHVLPVAQISERLGRTVKGIYRRAHRLGLTSREQSVKVPWTPDEDAVLKAHLGTMTYAEIGLLLGRTDKSVKARALSLQLRGGPKPRLPKPSAGQRRCHDCGRPTSDYRCSKCWAKLREKYKYEE
jgi:hypothetical protein